jgi:hypothetical protein
MKSKSYHLLGIFLVGFSFPVFLFYSFLMSIAPWFMEEKNADSQMIGVLSHPLAVCFYVLVMLVIPFFLFYHYNKNKNLVALESITIDILRWTVALLMFYYGFVKLTSNFFDYTFRTMDSRVVDVHSFDLTWYYFGKSNFQVLMIGFMEVIPAILLLFRRTYFLGTLLILPVAGNVLWTNIFNSVSGFTFLVSIIIVILSLYILYSKKEEIISFLTTLSEKSGLTTSFETKIVQGFRYLTVVVLLVFLGLGIKNVLKHDRNKIQLNKGAFELASLQINHQPVVPLLGDTLHYKTIYLETQSRWNAVVDFSEEHHVSWIDMDTKKNGDSVAFYFKEQNAVENSRVNKASKFEGIFTFSDSMLLMNGIQYGDTIHAVYKRKELKKNKWYW